MFEVGLAKQLYAAKISFKYETMTLEYRDHTPFGECGSCGSNDVYVVRTYTPDFILGNGIVIEAKGKLDAKTRKKLLSVKRSNPDLDLHLVFMKDNKISRNSKTRYSGWAIQHGFTYSVGTIDTAWFS